MKDTVKVFYKELLFLIFALVVYTYVNEYMTLKDAEAKMNEYIGTEGKTTTTLNLKMTGLKKAGRSMLWLKQILDVGGHKSTVEIQKSNSEAMSYLDPYFVVNYYYSATVLALIRTNNRHDYGMEIMYRGMSYNPNDAYMPLYAGGIVADKKNDIEESLVYFEKIVEKVRDEQLLNVIAFVYDKKYQKEENSGKKRIYMEKALYYYEQLLEAKDEGYRKKSNEKIEEYYNILKKRN